MADSRESPTPTPATDQVTDAGLGTRARSAFRWSFLNTLASRLGTLAIGIALARILGPPEYGVFAVAMVTLLATLSFSELGVSLAIVRWREDPARIAPTVNTISVASGLVLAGAMALLAPWLARTLGDARAAPVIQVMAIAVAIAGFLAGPAALLQREFRQKQRMISDQVNSWLGAVVSLILALAGLGAMSLAVGRIAGSLAGGALLFRWSPLPFRLGWDRRLVPQLLSFGVPLALTSILVFASGYVDQLLVGSAFGAMALGFYVLAFNLASWPVTILSSPLRQVTPALFARLQHDRDRMNRTFGQGLRVLAAAALPACLAISGAAAAVIQVVYGTAWAPAAILLAFLAAQAAGRILCELAYDYLVVLGRSRSLLAVQAAWLVAGAVAMLIGGRLAGVPGVAAGALVATIVVTLPLYAGLLRHVGVPLRSQLGAVLPAVAVGVAVWAGARGLGVLLGNPWLAAVAAAILGLAGMAVLLYPQRATLGQWRRAGEPGPA